MVFRKDLAKRYTAAVVAIGLALGGVYYSLGSRNTDTNIGVPPPVKTSKVVYKTETSYIKPVKGHKLSEKEINQLRRLHSVTWTWEVGKWTAFPSGSYKFHNELVPENVKKATTYTTYKEAGYSLDKLQEILLVDFRDYRTNITQETLNAGLMLPCAVALHRLSEEIGTLNNLDKSYPPITLIEGIERAYSKTSPRRCFRSSFQQLEAYENTTGHEYDPETHINYAGQIARPGKGPHGTGNALDVPEFVCKNERFIELAKKHGFRIRLPEADPVHLEYIGNDFVDFPRPDDVWKYEKIYPRLKEARI